MKLSDIQKLYDAQLITEEQRGKIIEHFNLDESRNKFLIILIVIGAILAVTGVVLVISANWAEIPGGVKIALGAALMVGAHALGWYWRTVRQTYPTLGSICHFIGAGLFLANIGLIGQVYHLSSREPNAIILWLAGIIPLAWILRLRSIHVLSLLGILTWLIMEVNTHNGWLYFASSPAQVSFYCSFGLLLYGAGLLLRKSRFPEFAPSTEKLGLIMFQIGTWLTLIDFWYGEKPVLSILVLCVAVAVPGLGLACYYFKNETDLSSQWRVTACAMLTFWTAFIISWPWLCALQDYGSYGYHDYHTPIRWVASILLVIGNFVQISLAIQLRAAWMVNLAILGIAFAIITNFFLLMGSMLNTGLIFLVGGVGLLALGYVLERKRRSAIRQIKA